MLANLVYEPNMPYILSLNIDISNHVIWQLLAPGSVCSGDHMELILAIENSGYMYLGRIVVYYLTSVI